MDDDHDQVSARADLGYVMDPETRADLAKRAATARARPDAREDGFRRLLETTPAPPPTPARDTCAVCGHIVRPLYHACPQCEGKRNRRTVDALAVVIRELKTGRCSGEHERRLVKQLYELGHPDAKGFLGHLEEQRARGSSGGRGKL